MLSYIPPATMPFFTKAPIRNSKRFRGFDTPFYIDANKFRKPVKVELVAVMPPHTTVYLAQLRLLHYNEIGGRVLFGRWRSEQELGRIGGMIGGILGCLGGLVGIFGGIIGSLAGKGKAQRFVLGTVKTIIGLGVLLLIGAIALLATGQWWVLYVPLFFMGILLLLIMGPMLPMMRRRYNDLELRRISAQDAGG